MPPHPRPWPHLLAAAFLIFTFALLPVNTLLTQDLSPVVVASGGGYLEGNRASLSYTVGEAATATYTGRTAVLTEGFQQTDLIVTSLPAQALALPLRVFPNPTAAALTVTVPAGLGAVELQLFTAQGQKLGSYRGEPGGTTTVPLDHHPAGVYYLRATDPAASATSTYKIVKTR